MAFITIPKIKIAGMAAAVPKKIVNNSDNTHKLSSEYDNQSFVEQTGVYERRIDETLTTSDLCYKGTEQLLKDLNWEKEDIEALIFVSQTFDFIAPATACVMQDKLGLSKECLAFDIELGCSGWVYGMTSLASLMVNGSVKKALLMVGDARRNYEGSERHEGALFGYAGTITALEYDENSPGFICHLGSDGSGYNSLYIKEGGSRYPLNKNSLIESNEDGKIGCGLSSKMNGMDVFSFGISAAPKSIKALCNKYNLNLNNTDFLILHQANKQMNDIIVKKLKFEAAKVPESLSLFGNTSSASIPLTIVTSLRDILSHGKHTLLCCGFGIGLSWGTIWLETDDIIISPLVEVESNENML